MYRINEIFYSLQGEGFYTGTPAVFIRFSGCNRNCAFCDTDFKAFTELDIDGILAEIAPYPSRHIVLTGGEPLLQVDKPLLQALKQKGYFLQVETNGTVPAPAELDWVTCSPKEGPWKVDRVDELKIVYQGQDVEEISAQFSPKVRFLQPCSGKNTSDVVAYILGHPWWRLSLQTHKLIDIR